jgi:adenylate cyclase
MADLIIANGGSINEFIGDAIVAVFGAPLDQPDHAERAAAAALAMQRAMDEFNQALVARGGQRFAMGIGLSTGEAVVGNIGSEQRAKYAVVGAAVNLAGRIEGCTVGGQILLSPATLEHIRDLAEVGPPLQVELKGVAGPVVLHELRGIRGRFAQRLDAADTYAGAPVSLPLRGWVLEGKQLKGDAFTGEVRRLAALHLDAITSAELAPFTNVRLRVRWAGGRESGDLYGKVAGEVDGTVGRLTRITLTSVDPEDQSALEAVVRAGHEPIAPAPVSKPPRP